MYTVLVRKQIESVRHVETWLETDTVSNKAVSRVVHVKVYNIEN